MGQVAPVGGNGAPDITGARVAAYAHNAGFSGNDLVTAVAVSKAESGWVTASRGGPNSNGTYDWGLWQINDIHKPSETVKRNPVANAKAAYKVYADAGKKFTPWAAYNSGAYKTHLSAAKAAVDNLRVRGPEWEREQVSAARTSADDPDNSSIVDDLKSALSPAQGIAEFAGRLFGNFTAFVLGLALVIVGVVLLLRKPIGAVAGAVSTATPTGRGVKAATAVAKPARVAKTATERAADSVAFAEAKKALLAEKAAEAPKRDFVAEFKATQAKYRASQGVDIVTGKR